MSIQWFNPLEQTPEGRLLKDVATLLKEVKNKKKADLDKDGKLSGYEKKRAKAIEGSMGYKSDRGERKSPNLPTPKGNTTKIDKTTEFLSNLGIIKKKRRVGEATAPNMCAECGKEPHSTKLLHDDGHSEQTNDFCANCANELIDLNSGFSRIDKTSEFLRELGITKNDEKNTECSDCKNVDCMGGCGMNKADMNEKNKYCKKHFNCSYSECSSKQKAQCDRECGKELKKYSQESSVENLFPKFQNVDGGMPVDAHGFTTNGTYPATNDGPKKSIVSETVKMPAFAKTEYTPKGSSLHMHYNDAGGSRANGPNIDTIEQRLASLTKHAGRNNLGVIGEIEGLLKQVKDLMDNPSN